MNGRKILGIIVVMAMLMTAIPAMAGNAKAESGWSNNSLLFFVNKWPYMTSSFTFQRWLKWMMTL